MGVIGWPGGGGDAGNGSTSIRIAGGLPRPRPGAGRRGGETSARPKGNSWSRLRRSQSGSTAEVEVRLADAGRVLLALPWANCFPFGVRNLWSEPEADAFARRPIPTSDQIRAMDQAFRRAVLIPRPEERRLVLMRSLVLPQPSTSGRPATSGPGDGFGAPRGCIRTLQQRWYRGIRHMVCALSRPAP